MAPLVHQSFSNGIPEDSHFLNGHFPGNPIVPGAILIGIASQLLDKAGYEIASILRMKFLVPLPPSQPFEIKVDKGQKHASLVILSNGCTVAEARMSLQTTHG